MGQEGWVWVWGPERGKMEEVQEPEWSRGAGARMGDGSGLKLRKLVISKHPAGKVWHRTTVADLRGARGMCTPLWPKISSFSCSFQEKLAK